MSFYLTYSKDLLECVRDELVIYYKDDTYLKCYKITKENGEKEIIVPFSWGKRMINAQPTPIKWNTNNHSIEWRDYQIPILERSKQELVDNQCCFLSLCIASGKTNIAIGLASEIIHEPNHKVMIFANRKCLMDQWKSEIEHRTSHSCQIVKPKDSIHDDTTFVIMNPLNVTKMPMEFYKDIFFLIADEAHLLLSKKNIQAFFHLRPTYLLGLSATPIRSDGAAISIPWFYGNMITRELYHPHKVLLLKSGIRYQMKYIYINGEKRINWSHVMTQQSISDKRNGWIAKACAVFKDRNILILCKQISQIQKLKEILQTQGEQVTTFYGKDRFNPLQTGRIVIGSTQKCGIGFDFDRLDMLIMGCDLFDFFIQYLGRVFRKQDSVPIIVDIVDGGDIMESHYQERKKIYERAGGEITRMKDICLL